MTVNSIETVQALIEELQTHNISIGSVWEYINTINNKKMFAVFPASQFCDIHQSLSVQHPELIWIEGKFIGKYIHLN